MEKVGLLWKMPDFFFKRLKLDQLRKSRAFSKKALLFPENARLFRLKLRTLESPEKIRGIEEMDEVLNFQFEDGELQREEEKEEEEAEEEREEEEDVDEQREDENPAHRPLKPSLPSQQGFTCSSCLSRNHFTAYPFCVCCGCKVL